jgi:predicted amidophosphoribosyltransferase
VEFNNTQTAEFCCPQCHETLRSDGNHEICSGCALKFERIDDIPIFVSEDSFYEGKFPHTFPRMQIGSISKTKSMAKILHLDNLVSGLFHFRCQNKPCDMEAIRS